MKMKNVLTQPVKLQELLVCFSFVLFSLTNRDAPTISKNNTGLGQKCIIQLRSDKEQKYDKPLLREYIN